MRLDHVSYAVSPQEFADTVQRLGALLGATFVDGGKHPSFGTRNFILPVSGGMYVEVVTTLDHPATEQSNFAKAVKHRYEHGGGWLGWVIAVDDISIVEKKLGRNAIDGRRRRPDGFDLQWKQIGVMDVLADPELPFFIEWISDSSEHPSRNGADLAISSIRLSGSQEKVDTYLGEDIALDNIDFHWVKDDEPGLTSVTFLLPSQESITVD